MGLFFKGYSMAHRRSRSGPISASAKIRVGNRLAQTYWRDSERFNSATYLY